MSSFLNSEIDKMIKKSEDPDKNADVRFSLTFSKFENRRIEYIRRKLKLSKQEILHKLIMAAIGDIEIKMGLLKPSEGEVGAEGEQFTMDPAYLKILKSSKTISSHFKDE